jgi:molybdopterin molybdotransferase
MIRFDDAYKQMMAAAVPLDTEHVTMAESLGRVLAEDIHSDINMPPFNKSAMDGYAGRRADLGHEWTVIDEVPAGTVSTKTVGENQCVKIMTGAPVPSGADCVVMVEFTEVTPDGSIRFTGEATADNICLKAEDLKVGDRVLRRGELIQPAHIAVLAMVGCTTPLVTKRPRVGVIVTGSELVAPSEKANGPCIRDSNSHQLCAQMAQVGAVAHYYGIVEDSKTTIDAVIARAQQENDLIVLSGGVSMGDYDFVPELLRKNGFKFLFESVAMQPGRPTIFGQAESCYCCGLPGNPVSTFVIFEILLKPFIYRLMGHAYNTRMIKACLGQAIRRRKPVRQSTVPVMFIEPGIVVPVDYHGSAHINSLCAAHGLLAIPTGVVQLEEGTDVLVRPI